MSRGTSCDGRTLRWPSATRIASTEKNNERRWFLLHEPTETRLTLSVDESGFRQVWTLTRDRDTAAAGILLELLQPGSVFDGFRSLRATEWSVLDGHESPGALASLRRIASSRQTIAAPAA